jgi:glycosyltransferase involved in cell wall biosynthesis
MHRKKEILIMITQKYPFGYGEVYLDRELQYFSEAFDEILLYPLRKVANERPVPSNVHVNELFCSRSNKVNKGYAIKKLFAANKILSNEIKFAASGNEYVKKNKKEFLAQVLMAYELADTFYDSFKEKIRDASAKFYSVWLDEGALIMSILKNDRRLDSFVLRLHGYDLYDSRREGGYMPFRVYCFNQVSKVFVVSKNGAEYTRGLNICPEKVMANYSGLNDYGLTREFKGEIRIISCSNLIKLKRVNIIIEALREIDFPITWKHYGDGEERSELTRLAQELPDHVKWSFEGHVSHENLMKAYAGEHWTCFLHMSESEGLPLALAEAMSFGIPVIACNVGGVSEIVSEKEGYLLPKMVDPENVRNIIKEISTDQLLQKQLSKNAREKYVKHFNAEKNYLRFVRALKEFG